MYKKQSTRIKRGLSALMLSAATFWGVTSAEAQIVIDGHFADWDGINAATVDDSKDMADSSGDIRQIQAHVEGNNLHLSMTVHGIAAPSVDDTPEGMKNRYYYHWLLDTDNDTATGFKTDAYEGNSTGLAKPLGVDLIVQFGWRDGKPNGLSAYDVLIGDDAPLVEDYEFSVSGDTISAVIPLADLKLTPGQSVGFSAFQEGASDGWAVDFVESASLVLSGPVSSGASVNDPKDMADSSGDVKNIKAVVKGDNLHLSMTVHGIAAPSVDDTPEGMKNRYYYHWLFDTDNDTATGFKTDAYEGNSTGLAKPLGVDLIVQFGWRDGKPNGLSAYDVLIGDDAPLVEDYAFSVSGDTINAVIPLADLKLTAGQSVGFSAFQEGASDGWSVDFVESDSVTLENAGLTGLAEVSDPKDMADSSGDIRNIQAVVQGSNLFLRMTVDGLAAPSADDTPEGMKNRYYYHWLLDTDNDTATGFKTDAYEGNSTGLAKPLGVDLIVQFGWRDGKPNGLSAYDVLIGDDAPLVVDYTFATGDDSIEAMIPLADLGLTPGQTVGFSAFQEGASDGWAVDFVESSPLTLKEVGGDRMAIDGNFDDWTAPDAAPAPVTSVDDPKDMADSSGDIKNITAQVEGSNLHLTMSVYGIAAPSVDDTPEGMKNRYYYHWLLDTDNDTATGFKTDAYEGNSTGLAKPLGVDLIVQFGWRDGKPNGLSAYDVLIGDDAPLVEDYEFSVSGDTISAVIPLADLKLTPGQSVGFSAFQEGASDGWAVDFVESDSLTLEGEVAPAPVTSVDDAKDMADSSGDIKNITAQVEGSNLHLTMSVYGIAAPSVDDTAEGMKNRYYYHWLLDTDNDTATGFKTDAYEGNSTGLTKPLGVDLIVQFGWRDGKPNGLSAYDVLIGDDAPLVEDYEFSVSGDTINAVIPLADLKLTAGQSVGFSAFQEGASDGWAVDFVESDSLTLEGTKAENGIASVDDPKDMADSSGDIKQIHALVENGNLYLKMSVYGIMAPSAEQTPEGMKNRYYYHWLLDTDNDTATGFKTDAYEGNSTGLAKPLGVDLIVQFGWRDGKPNGLSAYDVLIGDDAPLVEDYTFAVGSDSVEVVIPLAELGLTLGQSVGFSAFQEGASDGWAVDFVESTTLTLSQDSAVDMTLETYFTGNAFSFEIQIKDDGDTKVDATSISVSVDGASVEADVSQTNGVTVIAGVNPSLVAQDAVLTVSLTLNAGGATQSKDFVINVGSYTLLPADLRVPAIVESQSKRGLMAGVTQISSATTFLDSLHENKADLAEKQLAGKMLDPDYEDEDVPYVNEAHEDADEEFVVVYEAVEVVNWFEQAPGEAGNFRAGLGHEDKPFPYLPGWNEVHDGVVIEIVAWLELEAGAHKIGMNGEGGWKVSGGTGPDGILIGTFDNSTMLPGEDNILGTDDDVPLKLVPTYYPLDQYVNIVVTEAGMYPIRVLWFQSRHNKAPGLQLELFTVKDRAKHLINDSKDSMAIKAWYEIVEAELKVPSISIRRDGGKVVIEWIGTLQAAGSVNGPWGDVADDSSSPMTLTPDQAKQFGRAVRK